MQYSSTLPGQELTYRTRLYDAIRRATLGATQGADDTIRGQGLAMKTDHSLLASGGTALKFIGNGHPFVSRYVLEAWEAMLVLSFPVAAS